MFTEQGWALELQDTKAFKIENWHMADLKPHTGRAESAFIPQLSGPVSLPIPSFQASCPSIQIILIQYTLCNRRTLPRSLLADYVF